MKKKILIIDDEKSIGKILSIMFKKEGFKAKSVTNPQEGLDMITTYRPNCIITDINMDTLNGLDILKYVNKNTPHIPVIIMTAYSTKENAIEAVNQGAFYYLEKPFDNEVMLSIVKKALELDELEHSKDPDSSDYLVEKNKIIGKSQVLKDILTIITKISMTSTTVLIQGESGTGKELIARKIYELSGRDKFVALNCAALPPNLLESELFGYKKGAFTGAAQDKEGYFAAARKGVIFLDEIGELDENLQVKLLRVLQEREVTPIGSTEPIPVDIMVISATNIDLDKKVENNEFRKDLYYRLNVIPIHVPPLRERKEDIPALTRFFVESISTKLSKPSRKISDELLKIFMSYDWPGNIRELQNIIERVVVLENGQVLTSKFLPKKMIEGYIEDEGSIFISDLPKEILEKEQRLDELQDEFEKRLKELEEYEEKLKEKEDYLKNREQNFFTFMNKIEKTSRDSEEVQEKETEKEETESSASGVKKLTRSNLIDELNRTDFNIDDSAAVFDVNKSTIHRKIKKWKIRKKAEPGNITLADEERDECEKILSVLNRTNCDISQTSKKLGWSRGKLYAKLHYYEIRKKAY